MSDAPEQARVVRLGERICRKSELQSRRSLMFRFEDGGEVRDAFVALADGEAVAYLNQCRHLPITLDFGDGDIFTRDGRHFVCATHGAVYHPADGLCLAGPCAGARLFPVALELDGDEVRLADSGPDSH